MRERRFDRILTPSPDSESASDSPSTADGARPWVRAGG